ncbi:MAG: hypothetical protein ICV77_14260, partial [Cyanobacteria bacterium Co-bin8]|nr:hypothetical protein [Cyanobacteria bacterium Co-bin8]
MSLSQFCAQQHDREQALLRRVLLWGVVGSLGVHAIALALSQLNIWQRPVEAEIAPIELIVIEPPPADLAEETVEVEPPTPIEPAELSTEMVNPAPAAVSAAPPAAVFSPAPAAPPPSADLPEPEEAAPAEPVEAADEVSA